MNASRAVLGAAHLGGLQRGPIGLDAGWERVKGTCHAVVSSALVVLCTALFLGALFFEAVGTVSKGPEIEGFPRPRVPGEPTLPVAHHAGITQIGDYVYYAQ